MKIQPLLIASLLAVPLAASAAVTVFNDNFSGSTINSASPAPPTATSTSYEEITSKAWSPNPPAIAAGSALTFGLTKTSGGGGEVQALFAASPVTLSTAGDYVQLAVIFTNAIGLLTQDCQFGIGLFNSGGVLPWAGGMNNVWSTNVNAATGGVQNWNGYLAQIAWAGSGQAMTSRVQTRPPQTGADNRNQVTAVNKTGTSGGSYSYPNGTTVGTESSTPNVALVTGGTYAEVVNFTLQADGSLQITANLYTNSTTGALLTTVTANTGPTPLTNAFDAFSMGWRSDGNVSAITLNVSSIQVTKSLQSESACLNATVSATSMVVGQTNQFVTINIPADATSGAALSVKLVSTNPAVAYPDGASGGTLTVTFPQNSPYASTNVPITPVASGSTLFYITNATAPACISSTTFSGAAYVTCGTVSLTPATLALQTGQTNQSVTVALVSGMNQSGPVTVSLNNSSPGVATLQTYTVTFPQGGPTITNIPVSALTTGTTALSLTNLIGGGCATLAAASVVTVACDPITLTPNGALVSLVGQTSQVLTVSIPSYANQGGAVTVDLKSLNPSVVVPQGASGDTLALTFPAGGTNRLPVSLNVLAYGTATLLLTNNASAVGCSTVATNAVLVITVPVPDGTTSKTETFDSQEQATTDGWTDFLDQANSESYGFSNTGNAGGSPGEAGGTFVRYTNRNYYADTNIGGLTLNDYISASGQLTINPPSLNAAFNIGFFNTQDPAGSRNVLGLGLADGTYPHQRISAAVGLANSGNNEAHETFGASQLFAPEVNTWSFSYDPTAGATGNGQLLLTYNANGTPWATNIDLTAADRLAGANFNAFGMLVRGVTGLDTNTQMGIYMDNLTYTKGFSLGVIPTVTAPVGRTNQAGTTANFSATAIGSAPLTYRWQFNTAPLSDNGHISGSASNVLTITSVAAADQGPYRLVVSNSSGSVTSAVANLVVTMPTAIPLQVHAAANSLSFTWADANFSLAFATNVQGPYIKIPAAASPFVTNTSGAAGFFRLVWP